MTMIERVARALARHDNPKYENWWPGYERRARTAIAAMREPTETMVEGGAGIISNQDMAADRPLPTLSNAYRAMIETALSEEPSE